jgi:hypothetical protein
MASIVFDSSLNNTKLEAAVKESKKTVKDWAKDVEKSGKDMDRVFDKTAANIKEAIAQQKALVKELNADVKNLEKSYKNAAPGEGARQATKRLAEEKAYLAQEQQRLIDLQQEQIEINQKEGESANSLTGMIKKWALSLGGAAAALGILKKAFAETTQGMNLFNTVGAVTNQILYDITSGQGLSMGRIAQAADIQGERNKLREKEYVDAVEIARLENEYQQLYAEALDKTMTNEDKAAKIDEALATHNKAIDLRLENIYKSLRNAEKNFSIAPSSEKLKKEISQLNVEIENLNAERVSSTKRLIGMRSTIEKDAIEEEKKRRQNLDNWLKAIEEEQIERSEKEAEVLKQLQDEIAANKLEGKEKELLQLEQKYNEDLELYKDNEAIKAALAERYAQDRFAVEMKYLDKLKAENTKIAATLLKLDPGRGYAILNRAMSNAGVKPVSNIGTLKITNQTQAGIEKQVNENLEKQIDLRRQIAYEAANLISQLGEVLGLDSADMSVLNGFIDSVLKFASNDVIGGVSSILSAIVSQIGVAETFGDKIERINKLIDKQNDIIAESERLGNQELQIREKIALINSKLQKYEESLARQNRQKTNRDSDYASWRIKNLEYDIEKVRQELVEAERELADYLTGGITENTIADVIAEGFQDGKTSVDDFADYMNEALVSAVMEVFKSNMLGDSMTELQEYISQALSDKILTTEEKQTIDQRIKALADSNKELWDNLTQGLDLGAESPEGLAGGIRRQITEETGSELAGLFRRFADDERQIKDFSKQGIMHLAGIEANTYGTMVECQRYLHHLEDISKNTQPVYSGDL